MRHRIPVIAPIMVRLLVIPPEYCRHQWHANNVIISIGRSIKWVRRSNTRSIPYQCISIYQLLYYVNGTPHHSGSLIIKCTMFPMASPVTNIINNDGITILWHNNGNNQPLTLPSVRSSVKYCMKATHHTMVNMGWDGRFNGLRHWYQGFITTLNNTHHTNLNGQ